VRPRQGTGTGAVISPRSWPQHLPHYEPIFGSRALAKQARAAGDMIIVRYADDIIVGFEYGGRRFADFWRPMRERLAESCNCSLHPDKETR